MNFDFTEDHIMIRESAREFAQGEIAPSSVERDIKAEFPTDIVKQLGELGFMGMMVSPEYGGAGLDTISYVLALIEISKVDASVGVIMSVNNSLVCYGLEEYGTDYIKENFLTPLAKGEKLGAFCLSEPEKPQPRRGIERGETEKQRKYGFTGTPPPGKLSPCSVWWSASLFVLPPRFPNDLGSDER